MQLGEVDFAKCKERYGIQYECLPLSSQWDLENAFLRNESLVTFDLIPGDGDWTSSEEGTLSKEESRSVIESANTNAEGKETLSDTRGRFTTPTQIFGLLEEAKKLQRGALDSATESDILNEPPQQLSEASLSTTSVPGASKAEARGVFLLRIA